MQNKYLVNLSPPGNFRNRGGTFLLQHWASFRHLIAAVWLFATIACGCVIAQTTVPLQSVGTDHEFTETNLIGKWITLRNEIVEFQVGGSVNYQKPNGELHQGYWSVSNGTITLTWPGMSPSQEI